MKESTTKEKVLKKVRNALMQSLPSSTSNIDFDKSIFEVSEDALDIQFVKAFKELGGRFIFCEDFSSVQENIALIINQLRVNELVCTGENIPQLTNAIELVDEEDPGEKYTKACLSNCEYLIGNNGGIMVSSRQSASRDYLSSTDILIVVANVNQLVPDSRTALLALEKNYPSLPSMVNIICGTAKDMAPDFNLQPSKYGHQQLFLLLTEDI